MATAQDIQAWLAAHPGASDPQIAAAMQQNGVTPDQVSGATGMDPTQVQSRYGAATGGLTGDQVNQARNFINQQWGGSYGANGQFQPGSAFNANGQFNFNPGNTQTNAGILGAGKAFGYNDAQLAQVLGYTPQQVSTYESSIQPLVNSYQQTAQHDFGSGFYNNGQAQAPGASSLGPQGVTNDQINGWLQSHPGATDQQIAQAMTQYGVSPAQMSAATGVPVDQVQQRYNAANLGMGPSGNPSGQMTTQSYGPNGGAPGQAGPMSGMGGQYGSTGGYMGGGAFGPAGGYGYFGTQGNPYLDGMAQNLVRQSNLGLTDALNGIRSDSVGTGNMGGAREGVAQGVAIGRAQDALQGNLAGLYGGAFEGQQNRGLQQYGIDTNAYLGNQGQMLGFYNNQRQLDQNGVALGAQLYGMGQQQQWAPYQNAANIYGQFSGYGTQTGQQSQGGGGVGALGGAIGGGVLSGGLGLGGNNGVKYTY